MQSVQEKRYIIIFLPLTEQATFHTDAVMCLCVCVCATLGQVNWFRQAKYGRT